MKTIRFFKIKTLLFVLFGCITTGCSKDNPEIDINYSYIKFSYDISSLKQNSVVISDNGEYARQLAYNTDLYIENLIMINYFEVLSDLTIVEMGETLGFIRISNNQINIYKKDSKASAETLIETVTLSSPLEKGIIYNIGFSKQYNNVSFFLKKDETTIFEQKYSIYSQTNKWRMCCRPFIKINKGSIRITKSLISSGYKENPKVSIFGDSFVEGWALVQFGNDSSHKWSTLLAKDIGLDNCFIEGIGGESINSSWVSRFVTLNNWFKAKYVIISIGTNNQDIDEYKKNMTQVINMIKENNQTPILITVTPRAGYDFSRTGSLINDWVRSSEEKYIDMYKAVTKEDDPTSWKDGCVLPDNIHPTIEGYKKMYDQLKLDCPFLLGK